MTAKKKTLIELMLDAGVTPEGINGDFIVCDKTCTDESCADEPCVRPYTSKPSFDKRDDEWSWRHCKPDILILPYFIANWKSTIITKQQFIDAYNEKQFNERKQQMNTIPEFVDARGMNKGVTNVAEDKQVEDVEPCMVVDNSTYDCTTTDDSGISLSLVDVAKSKSDGSTASYYELPEGAKELQDLISHRDMNSQVGEIFRACYRYGLVEHSDKLRDAKKIKFYAEAEIKRLEKLQGSK